MATLFSDVNKMFLRKITDFYLANLFASTPTIAEDRLYGFMESASVKFSKCKKDLTDVDMNLKQFNPTLSLYEKEILSLYMVVEWCSPEINHLLTLKQLLTDTDFKIGSQHLMLKALLSFKDESEKSAEYYEIKYTYDTSDPNDDSVNKLVGLG